MTTLTEILPSLKELSHKEKLKAVQFLVNEMAAEEENWFSHNQEHSFYSQHDAFEASQVLLNMLEEDKANALS